VVNSAKKLLVVEDDPGLQDQLRWCFDGYEVTTAGDRAKALDQLLKIRPPVVTLDLGLPPDAGGTSEGFATLGKILELAPQTKVIVITGNADRENAARAVGMGAYDFFNKPIDAKLLGFMVERAYRVHELEAENSRLQARDRDERFEGMIACSPQMLNVCRTIEKVAPSDATVMLLGESGTGKELLARALHRLSARAEKPFVAINCAAIPENLLESELFGYEKGAFTGALRQTRGKVEFASGGTLFLDEIGDLPMSLQAKLLRFLQERVFERVGGREEIAVDVRVVSATNQDIQSRIQSGQFREDLYYRIGEITVTIPPLRERTGDALLIARSLLDSMGRELGRPLRGFTPDALNAIGSHPWPGNVREMKNRVKRAAIMAEGTQVTARDLELDTPTEEAANFNLRDIRERAERDTLLRALGHSGGKISQAADLLGVSRPTLYDLLKKYNVSV
jgi:two-component system NtrC family response regulator